MSVLVCLIGAIGILLIIQSGSGNHGWHLPRFKRSRVIGTKWPELVDDLASSVRAGMSLPQAMAALEPHVTPELKPALEMMLASYRATGDFRKALLQFARAVNDPAADQFVSALILASELGGADLGSLLRVLSENLRTQAALSGEIKARQSWTVNGAKLAVAAPWLTVGVLSTRADARNVYFSSGGIKLLEACLVISIGAYWIMQRVGKLPTEARILEQS